MSPDTIFTIANSVALVGWLVLILFPNWQSSDKLVIGVIITLLAIIYLWLILSNFHLGDLKKFNSLEGVADLFQNKKLLTAGWIHYLAFDLLAGLFIKNNAARHGISYWFVIACLVFTFMLGPIGFLLYLLIRSVTTKQYFADNF
jgi:hypothetical protein